MDRQLLIEDSFRLINSLDRILRKIFEEEDWGVYSNENIK